jgi:hypothetical protein
MKTKKLLFLALVTILFGCNTQNSKPSKADSATIPTQKTLVDTADLTNNFYDNEPTFELKMLPLMVVGEIANPGTVDFSKLPVHSVIVKETLLDGTVDKFTGAYRYDGYSLFDILNEYQLNKANSKEFKPIIDLYVVVESQSGEKVIFSWGEIYYPNHLHEILIAKSIMRIVPSKTKDMWPLGENSKIIAGPDLITERNIENPVKITVKSVKMTFEVDREIKMFYPKFDVYTDGKMIRTISEQPSGAREITYETIFYGRGRGIHSTTPFHGVMLKDIFKDVTSRSKLNIQTGMLVVAALDGYRTIFTYSEVFNRNDQSESILIYEPKNEDGGAFTLFPASDFFSDRSVKSVKSIYFDTEK